MNLNPTESRILRRELAAVTSLLRKGLIAVAGSGVELTDAGHAWIAQDAERVRLAKGKAGHLGGAARAKSLTHREIRKIARLGGAARAAKTRKKKGREEP